MRLQTPRKREGRREGGTGRKTENKYSLQDLGCLGIKVLIPSVHLFLD